MRTRYSWIFLAVVGVFLAASAPSQAQIPDEFTNLEVLPEDIGKRELVGIMRQFASALGKRCHHCHVGEEGVHNFEGWDFASDDKETKRIARMMMRMTNEINNTHLPKLERDNVTQVRCVTCHRGIEKPETISNVVLAVADADGNEAAMNKYRELRDEYYGKAAYDFSSGPLNTVAEEMAQSRDDLAGAIEIMKMNIELNPGQAYPHILLGRLYMASGDKQAAIASIEKSLEIEPDNGYAKGLLEKMKGSSPQVGGEGG